jgi:hypothetical protein
MVPALLSSKKADIKAGRYMPSFNGSFLEQESVFHMAGWLYEKTLENSMTMMPSPCWRRSRAGDIGGLYTCGPNF